MKKWISLVIALCLMTALLASCVADTEGQPSENPGAVGTPSGTIGGEEGQGEDDGKSFIFEAEDVYVNDIVGGNFSSNPTGRNCVIKGENDMKASNGYYLGSLCNNGVVVEFELYTTEDVEDAELYACLSSNTVDFTLSSEEGSDQYYCVTVNGTPVDYGTISVKADGEFTEIKLGDISLKKDIEYNSIQFYTANSYRPVSGIFAAAPAIDYIKIVTDSGAEITQEVYGGNY